MREDGLSGFLGLFPGPKAENAELLERLVTRILRDNAHWRRNYFPDDQPLVGVGDLADLAVESAELEEGVRLMLDKLRRSFPFHNPRYIAHQQSETSMPALLGLIAGTLYNANNVTGESGPITLQMEIEATNRILEMVGYPPPPRPPEVRTAEQSEINAYREQRDGQKFAWAHLTSGGTVANMEALWVARNLTYLPLSIWFVASEWELDLEADFGNGPQPLHTFEPPKNHDKPTSDELKRLRPLLNLTPTRSLELLRAFLGEAEQAQRERAAERSDFEPDPFSLLRSDGSEGFAWQLDNPWSLDLLPNLMHAFPPRVFTTGAAHYSLNKACDLSGMGAGAIKFVDMDHRFRMSIDALRAELSELGTLEVPVAVVGIIGTTEEGAVDPLHEIVALRDSIDAGVPTGFWVHADGAWGGYFATLLRPTPEWSFWQLAHELRSAGPKDPLEQPPSPVTVPWLRRLLHPSVPRVIPQAVYAAIVALETAVTHGDWDEARTQLTKVAAGLGLERDESDALTWIARATSSTASLTRTLPGSTGSYQSTPTSYCFDEPDVVNALMSLRDADSITIDPHKMGYIPYPCGAIVFRDDLVRRLVKQKAPYITKGEQQVATWHKPLWDLTDDDPPRTTIDAPAPFTLEGSRPSSPAAALWLSTHVMPLDVEHHGAVVRASWQAARELYEWLTHWDESESALGRKPSLEFLPIAMAQNDRSIDPVPPDTNLVTFVANPTGNRSLRDMNELSEAIYRKFSISVEDGDHRHSYSQAFFLSRMPYEAPNYPAKVFKLFAQRADLENFDAIYAKTGLFVLRASVMTPYLTPYKHAKGRDLLLEFMETLSATAEQVLAR